MSWMIEDEHGTALCDGLSERDAYTTAQRWADHLGVPVYLWTPEAEEAEEIEPQIGCGS